MKFSTIAVLAMVSSTEAIRIGQMEEPKAAAAAEPKAAAAAPAEAAPEKKAEAAPAEAAPEKKAEAAPAEEKKAPVADAAAAGEAKAADAAKAAKGEKKADAAAAGGADGKEGPTKAEEVKPTPGGFDHPKQNFESEPAISDQIGGTIQSKPGQGISTHNPNSPGTAGDHATGSVISTASPAEEKQADNEAKAEKKSEKKAKEPEKTAEESAKEDAAPPKKEEKKEAKAEAPAAKDAAAPAKADAAPAKEGAAAPAEAPKAAALVQLEYYGDLKRDKNGDTGNCDPSLEVSQKQMDIELDYFSRTFDEKRYRNAKIIYNALLDKGDHPRVSVHTW